MRTAVSQKRRQRRGYQKRKNLRFCDAAPNEAQPRAKRCIASRVIEPRIEARSANLVGETKVDGRSLWLPQMCAEANAPRRTKSPLMAFAQSANRHDAFISYSA